MQSRVKTTKRAPDAPLDLDRVPRQESLQQRVALPQRRALRLNGLAMQGTEPTTASTVPNRT